MQSGTGAARISSEFSDAAHVSKAPQGERPRKKRSQECALWLELLGVQQQQSVSGNGTGDHGRLNSASASAWNVVSVCKPCGESMLRPASNHFTARS
jgi:hypothetical protein